MVPLTGLTSGAVLIAACLTASSAFADPDLGWETFIDYREGGDVSARLVYGEPNSDNVVIDAVCGSDHPRVAVVDLLIDLGPAVPGARTTAHFMIDSYQHAFPAIAHDSDFVPYGRIEVAIDDPLWAALQAGPAGDVSLFYGEPTELSFSDSAEPIAEFIAECEAIAAENPQ